MINHGGGAGRLTNDAGAVMLAAMRRALLVHYRRYRRDLPWRHTRDPYAIWVSEIMLQQTQVDTVTPRYAEFLARFPDVRALAVTPAAEVCEAWAGLGYYRRARHLHAAAQTIVRDHGGELPRRAVDLLALPGIGRYTAGAIASIAFGEEAPVLDGNVTRVLARVYALRGEVGGTAVQRALWAHAEAWVRGDSPGDLNQALMDLGATVCTPRAPRCGECPLARGCRARALGRPERFPRARARPRRHKLAIAFAWIEHRRGVYLTQRPLDGLWPGQWELPSAAGARAGAKLAAGLGVALKGPIARVQHTLSHRDVTARVFVPVEPPKRRRAWVAYADPLTAPLSALARKAIIRVRQSTLSDLDPPRAGRA